jgi:hypothetical protein
VHCDARTFTSISSGCPTSIPRSPMAVASRRFPIRAAGGPHSRWGTGAGRRFGNR